MNWRRDESETNSLELEPEVTPGLKGWTLVKFDYTGAREDFDLTAVKTVRIFIIPDDPLAPGQIVLDEIILVP